MTDKLENMRAAHRHAWHAWEDFRKLRPELKALTFPGVAREMEKQLHAMSHHLRHAVYRTGKELPHHQRCYVRRRRP